MSALFLSLTLGLVSPPPPPKELPLENLEGEADEADQADQADAEARTDPPDPAPGDVSADASSDVSGVPSEPKQPATPLQPEEAPQSASQAEISYDAYGDPIVPYGEPDRSQEALPFAQDPPEDPELPFAEGELSRPGEDLESAERPPRSTMSREALERQASIDDEVPTRASSPQRFAIEVKFGPFLPSVDRANSGGGLGPYAAIFGQTDSSGAADRQPKKGLYTVLGFEWQFANFGGPLSIGGQIGFFRDKADALLATPSDGSLRSGADQVSFVVVPVAALVGYRFELLADKHRIPLVPYARAGLAYGLWWSKNGSGDVSTNDAGDRGRGGSLGWQANLGLMVRMDFIDRGSALALDRNTGINHTYIFGEYQFSRLDGFGSDKRMSVGDDTYQLGLAIEF